MRKVTTDYAGTPVLRLTEPRDHCGGFDPETVDPLEKYRLTKLANKEYFDEARSATSLEERVQISVKHTRKEKHPEIHLRGPFKALHKFKSDNPSVTHRPVSVFAQV